MAEVEAKAMELEVPKTDVNDVITPVLSLESLEQIQDPAVEKIDQKDAEEFRMKQFTEEEMKQINDFSEKIDLHDSNLIITYGAGAQKRLADFSETALEHVRNKDIDEIGETVSQLVADLKVDPTESKGIKGLFNKGASQAEKIKAHYSKVETNVDTIARSLEKHQETLLKDVAVMERLFENNKAYFKELTMYIAAGRIALDKALNEELPDLKDFLDWSWNVVTFQYKRLGSNDNGIVEVPFYKIESTKAVKRVEKRFVYGDEFLAQMLSDFSRIYNVISIISRRKVSENRTLYFLI